MSLASSRCQIAASTSQTRQRALRTRCAPRNPQSARGMNLRPRAATSSDRKAMSDAEYVALKQELSKTALVHGTALSGYCLLGYGVAPALSAALGGLGAQAYLRLLTEYVDNVSDDSSGITEEDYTRNLVYEPVTDVGAMLSGALGKVTGVYSRALLQKRLLVPCGLVIGTSAWNHLPLPFDFSYGATFCGFLCYKTAVLAKTYDILRPLIFSARDEK